MPGVTISAGYGAGGSVVAPEVAKRLGLPVLDRAISSRVAALLQVTVPDVGSAGQRAIPGDHEHRMSKIRFREQGPQANPRSPRRRSCTARSLVCP